MSERRHPTDSEITDLLRRRSAGPAPDVLAQTVLESLASERALHPRRTTRPSARRPLVLLAAAATVVLVGGALAAGSGVLRLRSNVPPPAPSIGPLAIASAEATSPSPIDSLSPAPTALSLHLAWTKVPLDEHTPLLAWVGDRFVLADLGTGAVRTSTDGVDWQALQSGDGAAAYVDLLSGSVASWQDQTVGWLNPEDGPAGGGGDTTAPPPSNPRHIVTVVQPPAAPISRIPFKGQIESIGIGPKGMVAEVHSSLDTDAWVTRKLGLRTNNDWTMHVQSVTFKDGVLQIKLHNRPGLKVVWADQGFEPGDLWDGGFAWYSSDGVQWTKMPPNTQGFSSGATLPTGGFGQVVGVSDGFIASGACAPDGCDLSNLTGIWYSADGLTWRYLGNEAGGGLLPWMGGALATDGDGRFDFWTSGGSSKLPIAADLAALVGPIGVGPLGLVAVSKDNQKALVSRDGSDLGSSPIPAEMAAGNRNRYGPTIAVGDRTVLVLESVRDDLHPVTHSLWLGTFQP